MNRRLKTHVPAQPTPHSRRINTQFAIMYVRGARYREGSKRLNRRRGTGLIERRVTIVFFDAGGGHRSAAEALKSVLESGPHAWRVELLNMQELLDQLDLLRKATGIRIQDGYNLILRKGWTRLTPRLLPVLQGVIHLYHRPTVKLLCRYWKEHAQDLVLSVIPHFNRALAESLRKISPATAFVTLLTDF